MSDPHGSQQASRRAFQCMTCNAIWLPACAIVSSSLTPVNVVDAGGWGLPSCDMTQFMGYIHRTTRQSISHTTVAMLIPNTWLHTRCKLFFWFQHSDAFIQWGMTEKVTNLIKFRWAASTAVLAMLMPVNHRHEPTCPAPTVLCHESALRLQPAQVVEERCLLKQGWPLPRGKPFWMTSRRVY